MRIPAAVAKMLSDQGVVYLATSGKEGTPNVSPRTAYWLLDDETIAVCEWFRYRTYWNLQENNSAAMAVVDLAAFEGWQLKGRCECVAEAGVIAKLLRKIMAEHVHARFNRVMQLHAGGHPPIIIKLRVQEVSPFAIGEPGQAAAPGGSPVRAAGKRNSNGREARE
ncbi:MAG: pyridoxamine 5'-phosphate oxidase family protein [Nitrososphaerota archaeon]|jgi:uncharacterized pyridoxamine 5'-phosphate oxidase family protein|nr:pyridoxamine 5'-phosphate oxidase family protein [Nitrososphaerota archaeon]MDG6899727.1 pyridoxamine 5'-phosphate oxidase family protein [Nitrososphaerota archaeon]MDG6919818.1 pyridoxamine 5'-phosphate oxidase family protein [Nitrososphaerota archaeon]